ncbi:P-type conjugative transfer protein TrbL [Tatumella sp. TA1]|nr:P-type conjugative transfer protein TrbL [Tatumella sp. TA1]
MKWILCFLIATVVSFVSATANAETDIEKGVRENAALIAKMNQLERQCAEGNNKAACAEYEEMQVKASDNAMSLDPSFIDSFTNQFTAQINKWLPPITKAAKYLLFTLATISLVLRLLPMALKGNDFGDIIKELIIFILVIGIWFALIINAKDWTGAIIGSFEKLAGLSNGVASTVTPIDILQSGFIVVGKILSSTWNPVTFLMYVILSVIIIFMYAIISFNVLKVIIETLILTFAGILMLGFGGITFTSDYAKRYFTYLIGVGFKYYLILLIAGFGINFINGLLNDKNFGSAGSCIGVICIVALIWKLSDEIPAMAQSMVTGAALNNNNSNIGSAMAAMAAAAAAFTAACYAGAAAFKAAGAANAAGGGGAATGGLSGGDLANALSKGGGSGVAGGGGSGGSSSLPNGGKSGAQLVKEGKVQSPNKNTGSTATGTESGKPQQSRTGAALKAVAKSVGEGILNKAAGNRGSTAANITRAALNNAAQSQQSTESPRKPIASPYAKSTGNNSSGTSKTPNKGNNDTGENQ